MKMQLFETLRLKFDQPDWSRNPEFGLLDAILELHPELLTIVSDDILKDSKNSVFGRKDMPSVEQIFRSAIYKELKNLDYRELEYSQIDSRICEQFVKIDSLRPYSFQVLQKYISKISADNLQKLLYAINIIAINEGLEDLEKFRQDTTVVETNIHYPTNNSLVWDCIKECHLLLSHLKEEVQGFDYRDYSKSAKKTFFKINNTKTGDKRVDLFKKQLVLLTKCINQISNVIKKKSTCDCNIKVLALFFAFEDLLPILEQVYDMTFRKEIKGESVPNSEKIFSIYERHTDIIIKGSREILFGHKVDFSTGKSNLILTCNVLEGNPADSTLYQKTLDELISVYGVVPRDSATDGGYASKANMEYAQSKGIVNVVFNKIVCSLKNAVSSKNMETRLKKWRSGIEANISNFKRGFDMFRCNWKGEAHFEQKVLWSAIAYNIRVMTGLVLAKL